ncbi:hypothetical protein Tco_0073985 [Tanacetum coccineum]
MIGSLMYLTASRPDIMFAVCACSRFQVTPKTSHLHAVNMIFRYLKGQPKLGLWYPKESVFDLEAYSDSDYARANLDRKSTTGGCQFLDRRLISWQCKKQTFVATSTTEAEYVTTANYCGQVLWIQNQMLEYGFNFMNTNIYIDNESIICIVKNPMFYSKTKHIEIRHHFIRDAYEKKLIQVLKIHTDDNVADLLTKAFDGRKNAKPGSTLDDSTFDDLDADLAHDWKYDQERWSLKSWDFYKNCLVHTLILEDGTEIHMLAERKYPLTKETLKRMMSLKLIAESASDGTYNLLRFIQKQIDESRSYDGSRLDLSRLTTTLNRLERSIQTGINICTFDHKVPQMVLP